MILGRICCSGRFAETQGNPNSYYSGFHQEDKGADQRHYDLTQASAEGVHYPAKGSEHYVSRFVERQVDKMHEGSSNVIAFDGRLEEFDAPTKLSGWPTDGYSGSVYGSLISPTALGDLDGLDDSDVLFSTKLSGVYSLLAYGSDGEALSNLDFPITLPNGVSALGGFSIADIDRDGNIEIVFGTSDGLLHCWELGDCSTGYAPWVQFQHDHGRTGVLE